MTTTLLFDLDGTLLPMDMDQFTHYYFRLLAKKLTPHGYQPEALMRGIMAGIEAMVKNDGSRTNEEAFWDCFVGLLGEHTRKDIPLFEEFYSNEFQQARVSCGYNPKAGEILALAKEKGYRVALATNPLFPKIATESRIRWAGLKPEDFELYTTYEESCFCKPNLKYYEAVIAKLGVTPEECMMIGNDVSEDMVAEQLGMKVFLLTDCLLNKKNADISRYPQGGFDELRKVLEDGSK